MVLLSGDRDTPPLRQHRDSFFPMAQGRDDAGAIKNTTVGVGLLRQPNQTVFIALDLIARELAVHHRDVDPPAARADTEFVPDEAVICGVDLSQMRVQRCSNVTVTHFRWWSSKLRSTARELAAWATRYPSEPRADTPLGAQTTPCR